jgi:CRISPR-associated protein (TIGR03986 family)
MKATLTKQKKAWFLKREDGKGQTLQWSNIPAEWDGASVEVTMEAGQPVTISNEGKEIRKPAPANREQPGRYDDSRNQHRGYAYEKHASGKDKGSFTNPNSVAKAPYNFVPLNEQVVFPFEGQTAKEHVFFDRYDVNRNSGFIDLDITTKTPLFIRAKEHNFLMRNGKPVIPGSSLRGLLRSLVEIVSWSRMEYVNDSRFFFRAFADKAIKLRDEYKQHILRQEQVGILYKEEKTGDFYLMPSVLEGFIEDNPQNHQNEYKLANGGKVWEVYTGSIKGGPTSKRKNYIIKAQRLDKNQALFIHKDSDLIKEYKEDVNRKSGYSVLEKLQKPIHRFDGVPVFYQSEGKEVLSFGNTRNYRLPYDYKVKEHLYDAHRKNDNYDFAQLLFGVLDAFASRTSVEDAVCESPDFYQPEVLKILGGPKPTSFQLYLEQPKGTNTPKNELKTWNDAGAVIRGYKQYWHRKTPDQPSSSSWTEEVISFKNSDFEQLLKDANLSKDAVGDASLTMQLGGVSLKMGNLPAEIKKKILTAIEKNKKQYATQHTVVKAIKAGCVFNGRIRFENLTNEELGALLFALQLPDGCFHKLGMGKPLGLGSVFIKSELHLSDRHNRYGKLLDDRGMWHMPAKETSIDFKKKFETYMLQKLGQSVTSLWETERLSHLQTLLAYDENQVSEDAWLKQTGYMNLKEFRDRDVLPTPLQMSHRKLK